MGWQKSFKIAAIACNGLCDPKRSPGYGKVILSELMRVSTISKASFLTIVLGAMLTSCGSGVGYRSGDTVSSYWHRVTSSNSEPIREAGPEIIYVQLGETLYSLARLHNLDVQSLIDENGLVEPYTLSVGQELRIPATRHHVVVAQETIYSISKANNVDMASLALMNDIEPPYTISVGQRLMLPGTEAGSIDWDAEIDEFLDDPIAQVGGYKDADPITYGDDDPIAEVGSYKNKPDVTPYVTSNDDGRFLRPVSGQLISSFGPKQGGLHNDGINVAAQAGSPIFAADEGVVTYTGNELRGYGNLILIKHRGNWVTAYSHIHRFRVARGDKIKRGQHIADVGQTGNVTSPQLHFELRDGTDPVNPILHLNPS